MPWHQGYFFSEFNWVIFQTRAPLRAFNTYLSRCTTNLYLMMGLPQEDYTQILAAMIDLISPNIWLERSHDQSCPTHLGQFWCKLPSVQAIGQSLQITFLVLKLLLISLWHFRNHQGNSFWSRQGIVSKFWYSFLWYLLVFLSDRRQQNARQQCHSIKELHFDFYFYLFVYLISHGIQLELWRTRESPLWFFYSSCNVCRETIPSLESDTYYLHAKTQDNWRILSQKSGIEDFHPRIRIFLQHQS